MAFSFTIQRYLAHEDKQYYVYMCAVLVELGDKSLLNENENIIAIFAN